MAPSRAIMLSGLGLAVAGLLSLAAGAWAQPRVIRNFQTHGLMLYDAARNIDGTKDQKGFGRIAIPDITVELRKPGTPAVLKSAVTDLEGTFRIPEAAEGAYDLCWHGTGWKSECLPKPIQIQSHVFYAEPILLHPETTVAGRDAFPVVGDVRFTDGSLCHVTDIDRAVSVTALVNLASGVAPAQQVRANASGQFVVPNAPAGAPASKVAATCGDVSRAAITAKTTAWRAKAGAKGVISGNLATFDTPDAKSVPLAVAGPSPRHLILAGLPPRAANFMIVNAAKQAINRAAPGDTVMVQPTFLSGATKPVIFWQAEDGTLAASGAGVTWKLPAVPGQYTIDALIADGMGGWSRKSRVMEVTKDLRAVFNGLVRTVDGGSLTAANAKVSVNGTPIPLDAAGHFTGRIAPASDARYVLNVTGDGYLPVSEVFHRDSSGGVYRLERVRVTTFDGGTGATLTLEPPLRRDNPNKDAKPATVEIKGGSLSNASGVYTGTVTASGAILDPSALALPGDYDGLTQTNENQALISAGAIYLSLKDSSGAPLQLTPPSVSTIRIPLPANQNPATATPTIPLWYYDDAKGFWHLEGTGTLAGDAYVADVKHFSTINMDHGTVGNAVCTKVELDFLNTPDERTLRLTMTLPGGGTQIKQKVLDSELNAIFRMLPNQTLSFELLRADGTAFPQFVLKDRRNADAPIPSKSITPPNADQMVGVNLWPDPPFDDCLPHVLVTGDLGALPAYDFLTRKNANATDADASGRADAYYKVMDPNGTRTSLQAWLTTNGFQPTAAPGGGFTFAPAAQVVSVSYLNNADLGSGRKMHCRTDAARTACFVDNYAANGDVTNNKFNRDPEGAVEAQNAHSGSGFAAVAMEYAPVEGIAAADLTRYGASNDRVVKFFTFAGNSGANRVNAAALDKVSGNRWQPNVCMVCHGGNVPSTFDVKNAGGTVVQPAVSFPISTAAATALTHDQTAALIGQIKTDKSSFREFDLANLLNLQGTNPENRMRQLNCNYVRHTEPNTEVTDEITAWYGANCTEAGSPVQNAYLPSAFSGANAGIYQDVTGHVCRTCHIAQTGYEMINPASFPWSSMTSTPPYTCGTAGMPQALVPHNIYWMDGMHEKVLAKYGSHC